MSHRHSTKLKRHRKRSGFTQEELGFLLGHKQHSAISRYEAGERSPDLKTAFAYQVLFDSEPQELFPGLLETVRAQVGERAAQLSEEIRRGGDNPRAAYKLQKLAGLRNEVMANASAV